jgi:hypothetical protein
MHITAFYILPSGPPCPTFSGSSPIPVAKHGKNQNMIVSDASNVLLTLPLTLCLTIMLKGRMRGWSRCKTLAINCVFAQLQGRLLRSKAPSLHNPIFTARFPPTSTHNRYMTKLLPIWFRFLERYTRPITLFPLY